MIEPGCVVECADGRKGQVETVSEESGTATLRTFKSRNKFFTVPLEGMHVVWNADGTRAGKYVRPSEAKA